MSDKQDRMPDLGLTARPDADGDGLHLSEVLGIVVAVVWVGSAVFYGIGDEGGFGLVPTILIAVLPVLLIWIAVSTMRMVRQLRDEAARLQSTVEALRNAYITQQQTAASGGMKPSLEKRLEDIASTTRQTEAMLNQLAGNRDMAAQMVPPSDRRAALVAPIRPAIGDEQPALALGTTVDDFRAPLSMSDFIRALNFPENADDKDGFRALRLALEDRTVARLIRAAQDILTLLSEEGIYMDDLKPDHAEADVWRQFARGIRGREVATLAGIRDRSSLALTSARMREDLVFRDAGHHFLRTFDRTFAAFEPNATDREISDLALTRTARAFMLIGRVTGTFD